MKGLEQATRIASNLRLAAGIRLVYRSDAGMPDNRYRPDYVCIAAGAMTIPVCTLGLIVVLLLASPSYPDRYYR